MATDKDDALTLMMCDTLDEAVKEIARIKREARDDCRATLKNALESIKREKGSHHHPTTAST